MECTNEQLVTQELKDYKRKRIKSLCYSFMTQTHDVHSKRHFNKHLCMGRKLEI